MERRNQTPAERERTLAVIRALQGKPAPAPTPRPEPPGEETTVWRNGEVIRKSITGRLTQRRPIDPLS